MSEYANVFPQVYNYTKGKPEFASLFDALDREAVISIIMQGGNRWTEQGTYSDGLTDTQHEQLKTIMQDKYHAHYLYEEAIAQ